MTALPDWLPELITLDQHHGDWDVYLAALYAAYLADYVARPMWFRGVTVSRKRHPEIKGKEATFWHMISEGTEEGNRTPDLRRCERVRWGRAILDHADQPEVKAWENQRNGDNRVILWVEAAEFLVVLARRTTYLVFWTAYPVTMEHRKRRLEQEYLAYCRKS